MNSSRKLRYYTIPPPESLAKFVQFFWVMEGQASASDPFVHRCIACTGAEWIFHYRGRFYNFTDKQKTYSFLHGVDGLSDRYCRYAIDESFGIFGVHLYPYALQPLFAVPASAFINQSLDFNSLSIKGFETLEERVIMAGNTKERVRIVSDFLTNHLSQSPKPEIIRIVNMIIKQKGDVNISSLADQCFRSVRQFQRIFKEQTGFTPKAFARVARFNAVLNQPNKRYKSLAEAAYDFGYYDQTHFIQDFKTYTGYTPKVFYNGQATELAWAS